MSDAAARFLARYGETLSSWTDDTPPENDAPDIETSVETPPLPEQGTPERAWFDPEYATTLTGLVHAALMRPKQWSDPAAFPSRGCFCSTCRGQSWWSDGPNGWRCTGCLPPNSDPLRLIDTSN